MVFVKVNHLYNPNNQLNNLFFTSSLIIMAILLHQSQVLFGINISFSDIFCFVLFFIMMIKKEVIIPVVPTIFF